MKDIDTSLKILGLTARASRDEVELAHKDLLDKLYADLLSPKSSVRKAAREKVIEVNEACDEILIHLAQGDAGVPLSSDTGPGAQGREPQVPHDATHAGHASKEEPRAEEGIAVGYIPHALAVLVMLIYVSVIGISGIGSTLLAIISGAVGWLAGHALIRGANILNASRLQKGAVAWLTTGLLFVVLISLHSSRRSTKDVVPDNRRQAAVKATRESGPIRSDKNALKETERVSLSAKKVNPPEAASWLDKGKKLILAGKYRQAIDALTRSIELNPAAAAYNSRGVALAYSHQYKDAESDYDKAVELSPQGDGSYYLNRGIVRAAQGNYKEAVTDYRKAASLGNREARDFFNSQNLIW